MCPVGKYVPGLTRGNEVTIRQVLSHTSGYQDYWPEDYLMTPMMQPESAQQILDTWAKKPLDFDPGTQWQYSNTNYVIAGLIVEKVSGEKLMDFLVEHIFRPLGMKSVWDSDEAKLTATDATPYIPCSVGTTAARAEGRTWLDVCCRRIGDDAARPGAVGSEPHRTDSPQAGELSRNVYRGRAEGWQKNSIWPWRFCERREWTSGNRT